MKNLIILLSLLFITSFLQAQDSNILVTTNTKGEVSHGTIDNLIAAINQGKKIRVGWNIDFNSDGKPDVTHWIDATFLTILNGHVFTQIDPIYKQTTKAQIPQVNIIESTMQWTGVIGTNSVLQSRYIVPELLDIEDDTLYEKMKKKTAVSEKMVSTIWAKTD